MPHNELEIFESDLRKEERKNKAEENIFKKTQQREIEEAIEKIKENYKLKFESQERKYYKSNEVVALRYLSFLEQEIDRLSAFLFEGKKVDIELMMITHQSLDILGTFQRNIVPNIIAFNHRFKSLKKVEKIWQENEIKWKKNSTRSIIHIDRGFFF